MMPSLFNKQPKLPNSPSIKHGLQYNAITAELVLTAQVNLNDIARWQHFYIEPLKPALQAPHQSYSETFESKGKLFWRYLLKFQITLNDFSSLKATVKLRQNQQEISAEQFFSTLTIAPTMAMEAARQVHCDPCATPPPLKPVQSFS